MRWIKLFSFALFIMLLSCSGAEVTFEDILDDESEMADSIPVLKRNVLIIGNSASRDAFSYVPFLFEEAGENFRINMVILYKGAENLGGHYKRLTTDSPTYVIDYCKAGADGKWHSFSDKSASEVLSEFKWDLVILQDTWTGSKALDDVSIRIHGIKDFIYDNYGAIPFAFMIVPPNPKAINEDDMDAEWRLFSSNAQTLLSNGLVDYVIPCGTAIQNALHTRLKGLGAYNYLSYEGVHLQEGLPCLIEAYTATQSLYSFFGIEKTIESSPLRITQKWVWNKDVPGRHGSVIEGTEQDYELCKRCAMAAFNNPYSVTLLQ